MALGGLYRPRLGAVTGPRTPADSLVWLRRATRLALLVLLAELLWIPFHSSRFAVTRVEVRGDPRLAAEVASRLRLPANTNILLAPTGRMAAGAARLPAVRSAEVHRDFQRRLLLTVERREAMAVIRDSKQARLIDPRGIIFTIRNEWGWGLPELAAPHLSAGDTRSPSAKAELAGLLTALHAVGPDPRLRIARLAMDKSGQVEALLESGTRVRLGATDRLQAKTEFLRAALDQLGPDRIEFLDLRDPATAYWRERKAKPSPPAVR